MVAEAYDVTKHGGKAVLITGGSSGIGLAAARRFLAANARVAVLAHDQRKLQEAIDSLAGDDDNLLAISADVSQAQEVDAGVNRLLKKFGQIDVVFANAGINGVWAPVDELTPEEWNHTLAVNLNGTFHTIKYTVPHMRQRGGAIIITSSVNGTRMFSNSGATAYASTKAAQVAMTKVLALELTKYRIRVNVICPGAIESDIESSTEKRNLKKIKTPVEFPQGAIPLTNGAQGTAAEVAELVLFLASDAASHITGTEMWIDGGQSLLQG